MRVQDMAELEANAGEAVRFLKLLAHEGRLRVLCELAGSGELTVSTLTAAVGLSQSALSQHLARLRSDGLVEFRRDGQALHYRLSDPRAARLLTTLKNIFCP
jgi:DNA-binding transcriptional ArsR family regulator